MNTSTGYIHMFLRDALRNSQPWGISQPWEISQPFTRFKQLSQALPWVLQINRNSISRVESLRFSGFRFQKTNRTTTQKSYPLERNERSGNWIIAPIYGSCIFPLKVYNRACDFADTNIARHNQKKSNNSIFSFRRRIRTPKSRTIRLLTAKGYAECSEPMRRSHFLHLWPRKMTVC